MTDDGNGVKKKETGEKKEREKGGMQGADTVAGLATAAAHSRHLAGLPPHLATMADELSRGEAQLLDVREPHEAVAGKLAVSKLVPLSDLREGRVPHSCDPKLMTYLHCAAGVRVHPAATLMRSMGYGRVVPLLEGFAALVHMGFEMSSAVASAAPGSGCEVSTAVANAAPDQVRAAGGSTSVLTQHSRSPGNPVTRCALAPAFSAASELLMWAAAGASAAPDGGSTMASRTAAAKASLIAELSPDHVEIVCEAGGGSGAFNAVVVAERFNDLPLLERHRLVLRILAPHLGDTISVKAKTPKQWARAAAASTLVVPSVVD